MEPLEQSLAGHQENFRPEGSFDTALMGLQKFGSFNFLESAIEGVQNLNPERKARKQIFLEESSRKEERENLKKTLQMWVDILIGSEDKADMIRVCEQRSTGADRLLKKNLKIAIEKTRELESSYRAAALFFLNAGVPDVENISFVNAETEQLKDLDNPLFWETVRDELSANYDRLDLRENYSLLVVPGYLGSKKVIQQWAKIAYDNKVMLVTDFGNFDNPRDVMEEFRASNLASADAFCSNVIMNCNWLVGRGKYDEVGEQEDLYVSPAAALAGRLFSSVMSQVSAGKKYGFLYGADGAKFSLKKGEIADLESLGLVPMVKEYGVVMAFSAKTLFNGDNIGLQTYSVVRVFDYVAKVLMDFLNRRAFENFAGSRKDIQAQIEKYLDSITGNRKLIESFTIKRFMQDPIQKDRIYLDIFLKPFFPAKTFVIKLDGHKGEDSNEWDTEYEQG